MILLDVNIPLVLFTNPHSSLADFFNTLIFP